MIKFLEKLNPTTVTKLTSYLESKVKPLLTQDVSSYAPGRRRIWLQHEWSLSDKTFMPGYQDPELWAICKKLWSPAEIGLVSCGPVGIKLHRDDSYTDYLACGVNLGECNWLYDWPVKNKDEKSYPGYKWVSDSRKVEPTRQKFDLTGGEVFLFNCKNGHAASNCKENRWSINLWHVKKDHRDAFKIYLKKNNES